jgi:hypothetical protein
MAEDALRIDRPGARRQWAAAAALAASLLTFCLGFVLAWHHPLWPSTASAVFLLWVVVSAGMPGIWLFVVPAVLPLLNFSPWTGWLIFDEFDILVLGALAGGTARLARDLAEFDPAAAPVGPSGQKQIAAGLAIAYAALGVLALLRARADAGGWSFGWFDGYADPSNSLRLSKSLAYAAALWPLVRTELRRSPHVALERFARGMQVGLTGVGLALLWERAAYPGLLDFSARYRTTATFWEMHVGGAAIDSYLALATPFAAWALASARSPRAWALAAMLALLTGHACLTTFSRGAYVGVALPLLLLGSAWWLRRLHSRPRFAVLATAGSIAFAVGAATLLTVAFLDLGYGGTGLVLLGLAGAILVLRWRTKALLWRQAGALALTLALIAEAVAVIAGGSFLRTRLDASEGDLGARLTHWRHGVSLLKSPTDWLFGIGSGRLPSRYAREIPRGEFSGTLAWAAVPPHDHVARLSGPPTVADLAGLFAMTQRVSVRSSGAYRATLKLRTATSLDLSVDLCEQHLLYSRQCQGVLIAIEPQDGGWQSITASLSGPDLDPGDWYARRLGTLSVSVRRAGAMVEFATISVTAPDGAELLDNGDFAAELAHWFPTAESHYLPWHIDNLYLELLVEHGLAGLAIFLLLLTCAFSNLFSLARAGLSIAPVLAAALTGALLVGSVSSILDVPRISFLLFLISIISLHLRAEPASKAASARVTP